MRTRMGSIRSELKIGLLNLLQSSPCNSGVAGSFTCVNQALCQVVSARIKS
jgi:hypothetical protein